ncbi:MAG TPA: carboxypeptidase-like regulatory domain-containing protein, partial [Planctomycetota bacterium]|nr:carboxypeptidase-like regulatory domain-containing protein [Planctomycetota bacterium]
DRFWGEAVTNGSGDYDFTAVPLRRVLVRAWTPTGWVERHVGVADEQRCDLAIPALAIGTRVVRVKGLPPEALPTARVEVTSVDVVAHKLLGRVALRADGTAEFMPTHCCLVQLVVPGFASAPVGHFITGGEAPIEFEVARLAAAHTTVKGRARDGRNRPVAGIRIVARDRSGCDLCSAVTDATGDFVFAMPLPPHSFVRLGLELREWHLIDSTTSIADGFSWIQTTADPVRSRELFLERTGDFRSELRGESGTRFVFADVEVIDAEHYLTRVRTVSDRAGRVDLRLPPGDYEFIAAATDGQITSAMAFFAENKPVPRITWKPLPSGSIEGVLLDDADQPVPGVELFVALQEEHGAACARRSATVLTDKNGRFRCRGLTPGIWTVVGRHEQGIEGVARVTKDKSETVDLHLTR